MVEPIEEESSEQFDFHRLLDVARRRHVHFLIPMFAAWAIIWGASWVLHPIYKSSTLILVEEPTMPKDYVAPNVSNDIQDRLQSITQQILSRTRLLTVANNLHLYESAGRSLSPDERVEKMQKDVKLELVRDERNQEITAFRISFSARDPHVAQQVTQELADIFIHENLRARQQESEGTTKFLEGQLEDARAKLAEQEGKVRSFETSHIGALPTQQASNLQILSGFQSRLQNEQDALNTAKQQRVYYQTLLQQSKEVHAQTGSASAGSSELTALDTELATLQAKLADLSSRYTDQYPDVVKLKDQIAKTQRLRAQAVANAARSGDASGGQGSSSSSTALIQSNLHANEVEISNREHAIAALQGQIAEYQGRLNEQPATEQQLAELTRGYDQSKANYDDLLKKMNASSMATTMEQAQQGERFTSLDPPSLPVKPDFPNRLKFCGIGLALGIALGLLVAGVFEFFDPRIYSEKDIKAMLPSIVISEIPEVAVPADLAKARKKLRITWAATGLAVFVVMVGAVVSYFHG
jgi:polysaccharide chain length determinant protein (PEP-CTERM system associated)